jgi:hypothetical protein
MAGEAPYQIDRAKDISMSVFVNGIRFRRHGGFPRTPGEGRGTISASAAALVREPLCVSQGAW